MRRASSDSGRLSARRRRYTGPPMAALIDLLYLLAAAATAPVWLFRMWRTGKLRTDWAGRMGQAKPLPRTSSPRLLMHAVSVGEVNAIRALVESLLGAPDAVEVVVACTTDTGFARARALWGDRIPIVRYPFDFSFAVSRFLRAVRPDAVALVELEVWPNFTAIARNMGIPVAVVNGRLSERSHRRYQAVRALVRPMFARLAMVGAQNEEYASRFRNLGVPEERIRITGTMKWDAAQIADDVPGAEALGSQMGIDRSRPLVVAGSTAPEEHELLVRSVPAGVQLLCAPRRPEWFDGAAEALAGCARRTRGERGSKTDRFLLDTIGELRQAYALADVVVVGRSFGELHGSDMMEPVALGKATVVGPAVSDFKETVEALLAGGGLVQCAAANLSATLKELLADTDLRRRLAAQGREVIRSRQGATARSAEMLRSMLATVEAKKQPAARE